jgi:hypothetical protein
MPHFDRRRRATETTVPELGLPMDYDELERWTRVEFERGYLRGQTGCL